MELRLPAGVVEVIPNILFVGPASAVKCMVFEGGVRHVVCCVETCDSHMYQKLADDAVALHKKAAATKNVSSNDKELEQPQGVRPQGVNVDEAEGSEAGGTTTDVAPRAEEVELPPSVDQRDGDDEDDGDVWDQLAKVFVAACPMEDALDFDISQVVPPAVEFIDAAVRNAEAAAEELAEAARRASLHEDGCPARDKLTRQEDRPPLLYACFVHCSAGVSRSPTVVAAYLITRKNMTLADALKAVGPLCRPNPGFIRQLVQLEESCTGLPSTFDLKEYFVSGLMQLFPSQSEADIRSTMSTCSNDVVAARSLLMKRSLLSINRDEAMIGALVSMVDGRYVAEAEVREVYAACNKQRDQCLLQLLERQNVREEEVRRGLASKSSDH